jgi:hypothetical protein
MPGKIIKVRDKDAEVGVYEKAYLPEITKGIGVTLKHVLKNLFGGDEKYTRTVSYPDVKVEYPVRFRGDAPADPARRRRAPLRRLLHVLDGVPGPLHQHRRRRERRSERGEAAEGLRDRRAEVHLLRHVRGGVPGGRDPHGHRRARQAVHQPR